MTSKKSVHIHTLGIGGTFMGSLAVLAKNLGYHVTGCDKAVYPPMSTVLADNQIPIIEGYDPKDLPQGADYFIVGNVLSRGMPIVETLLNQKAKLYSGPQWLGEYVLHDKWVLAVSGTHGKTTTASLLAWVLEYAGLNPGFLIGGVAHNFEGSSRLGGGRYFVIEADEYDSAFFDKRSKFVHYWPKTLIINNLEFDHSDIFNDLSDIQKQFHYLMRMLPESGCVISPFSHPAIDRVLDQGCWAHRQTTCSSNANWYIDAQNQIFHNGQLVGQLDWVLLGEHNRANAQAALAAAVQIGVSVDTAIAALSQFKNVARRLELKGEANGIRVYDDFAHHPTAIRLTLAGVKATLKQNQRLVALVDLRSNSMVEGTHQADLPDSVMGADKVYFFKSPKITWDVEAMAKRFSHSAGVYCDSKLLLSDVARQLQSGDCVVCMSNGAFDGVPGKLAAEVIKSQRGSVYDGA